MNLDRLDSLLRKLKGEHLCKDYKKYDIEVQEMIERIYRATYRMGLFDNQIIYILDEALTPFKKGGK